MVTRAYLGDGMFEELKPSANAADVQRCRNEWACTAKRFVCKRAREGEPDVAVDQARLKRKKAYQWTVALDQVLRTMTGNTLQHWAACTGTWRRADKCCNGLGWMSKRMRACR